MAASPLIGRLIEALRCLPGVGPKSAQRMAYHLLERNRDGARHLAQSLLEAIDHIGHCRLCRDLSEGDTCTICASGARNRQQLCVVESPTDVQLLEASTGYQGLYFVLMGHLSPLDGLGPNEIGLNLLERRIHEEGITEIILATNPTVEGEATAHYIHEMVRGRPIKVTRIAYGVPIGGELEYVDGGTLSHAFSSRNTL